MNESTRDPRIAYQDDRGARRYRELHEKSIFRRARTALERRFLGRVLDRLGPIDTLLDLPCGAGRFWPMLRRRARRLIAADASAAMIAAAPHAPPAAVVAALPHLPFRDGAVDVVFCHRLLHHFADEATRIAFLRELRRVAGRAVVLSFWITGNRRARREEAKRRAGHARRRFAVSRETLIDEARTAGFRVESVHEKLRGWSPLAAAILLPIDAAAAGRI